MPPLPPNLNCRRLTNEKSPCLDSPNIQSQGSFKPSGQSTCWTTVPRSNFGTMIYFRDSIALQACGGALGAVACEHAQRDYGCVVLTLLVS
uniref:Unnamed protein product n=1 Tax=Macaca fascicularis TaxID=9541 RepID=Q9N0A0_MACFA|nr:unnamed protein product [Macaca fascicularis]